MSLRLRESEVIISLSESDVAGYEEQHGSPQAFRMFSNGDIEEAPLKGIVERMRQVLEDPEQFGAMYVRAMQGYVGSMEPKTFPRENDPETEYIAWLMPASALDGLMPFAFAVDGSDPRLSLVAQFKTGV